MSHFGRERRSSLAPRAAWVIEGDHHRGRGRGVRPRRAGDSGCAVVAGACRQLPAFVVLCDHAFAHRCMRSCWQACRDRRRREGHPFSSLKLIGCLEWRLKPTLQTLQWECGSSRTFPVSKARRRYTNLTVWLPPHVTFAAEQCLPPSAAACISAAATASAAYSAAVSPPAPRTAAPPPVVAPPILPTAEAAAAPSSRRRPFALRRPVPPRPSAPLRPAVAVLSVQCCVVLKVVVVLARIGRSGSLRRFRRCAERLVLS